MANLEMSDAEFNASLEHMAAQESERAKFSPVALAVNYSEAENTLQITLNNGLQLSLQPENLQFICQLSPQELSQVQISPLGDLLWAEAGHGVAIQGLLSGRFGSRKWMEHLHAEKGIPLGEWADSPAQKEAWARAAGTMTSAKKKVSSRINGQQGGRPRQNPPQNQHVEPSAKGWRLRTEGKQRGKSYASKSEAIQAGEKRARQQGAELIIHERNGTLKKKTLRQDPLHK